MIISISLYTTKFGYITKFVPGYIDLLVYGESATANNNYSSNNYNNNNYNNNN